jgi:hypothetical protein
VSERLVRRITTLIWASTEFLHFHGVVGARRSVRLLTLTFFQWLISAILTEWKEGIARAVGGLSAAVGSFVVGRLAAAAADGDDPE